MLAFVDPRVFGLTGGIGSGKTTVAEHYRARRLPVVDADQLAREVVLAGSSTVSAIAEAFGAEVLREDGELDRAALAERVFSDPASRKRLETITHPAVQKLAQMRFLELAARGEPLFCYEVPLLFEARLERGLRPVVVVRAEPAQQIARAAARDRTDPEKIRHRLEAQLPLETKLEQADYVIDNRGSIAETYRDADRVLEAICANFGIDASRYRRAAT